MRFAKGFFPSQVMNLKGILVVVFFFSNLDYVTIQFYIMRN